MKLIQLQYFEAVCRLGSVSKAAIELSVSQPAISSSIRELENEFSVSLFLRVGRKMELTNEGRTLLELARDLLKRAENTTQIMQDLVNNRNHLRLGMSPLIASSFLPLILKNFSAQYPEVKLTVEEGGIYTLQKKLDSGELDIVLNSKGPSLDSEIYRSISVKKIGWCYCTNRNNRLANRQRVSIREIGSEPLISFVEGYHHADRCEDHFAEYGVKPNFVYYTEQLSTVLQLIRYNDMSSLLYGTLAESNPDLRFIPLEPSVSVEIMLFWRKDNYLYNDMQKLIRCIRNMRI